MFAQPNRSLASCVVGVLLAALMAAPVAFAKVVFNTIDASALVTDDGRHLVVTGPISCTAGERAYFHVTLTQRTTGALAEGQTVVLCTGDVQQWVVDVTAQGREPFLAGPATAVASARTTTRDNTTDAHQWVVEVTLIEE